MKLTESRSLFSEEGMKTNVDRKAALRAIGLAGALVVTGKFLEGRANRVQAQEAGLTPTTAAERFGADEYSSDPANWEINEYGGAHLLPREGEVTRVNMDGAAGEFYLNIPSSDPMGSQGAEWGVRALTLVVDGRNSAQQDVVGGTIWPFPQKSFTKDLENLWGQVTDKEAVEQVGILVLPVGFTPGQAC